MSTYIKIVTTKSVYCPKEKMEIHLSQCVACPFHIGGTFDADNILIHIKCNFAHSE